MQGFSVATDIHSTAITDSVIFDQVGITGASTQTGIAAGLNMFTWFCQVGATLAGTRIGRRTIILWTWPFLLLALAGLCATGYVPSYRWNRLYLSDIPCSQWCICKQRFYQHQRRYCDCRPCLALPRSLQSCMLFPHAQRHERLMYHPMQIPRRSRRSPCERRVCLFGIL
jgi:hypothetical protein